MIEKLLTGLIVPMSKKIVDTVINEAMDKVDEKTDLLLEKVSDKFDEMTVRSAKIIKELIPPIISGALFFGVGVIILVLGASAYIDSVVAVEGAGFMIGGLFLLLIGLYYKVQLDKAMEKVERM